MKDKEVLLEISGACSAPFSPSRRSWFACGQPVTSRRQPIAGALIAATECVAPRRRARTGVSAAAAAATSYTCTATSKPLAQCAAAVGASLTAGCVSLPRLVLCLSSCVLGKLRTEKKKTRNQASIICVLQHAWAADEPRNNHMRCCPACRLATDAVVPAAAVGAPLPAGFCLLSSAAGQGQAACVMPGERAAAVGAPSGQF